MAFINGGAKQGEPVGDRAAAEIGAGDFHVEAEEDFGNTAHADAADTDEVRVLAGGEHGR